MRCPWYLMTFTQNWNMQIDKMINEKKPEPLTTCIKHLAVSGLSSGTARIKSTCNLTGRCFEMQNVSYTQPLADFLYICCFLE